MKKSNFDTERELSFEIPVQDFLNLFSTGVLVKTETLHISQKWCVRGVTQGVPYSTRVRRVYDGRNKFRYAEHTMKYYLAASKRLEFNSRITEKECQTIFDLHPQGKVVNKTRLLFTEKSTDYPYPGSNHCAFLSADIIEGNQTAIIEVEFTSKEAKEHYKIPSWLRPYVGGK